MKRFMFYFIIIAALFFSDPLTIQLPFVSASDYVSHIVITEVLYDPINSESGGEAIELYNPTNAPINISGYIIKTKSYSIDATIPKDTILQPGQFYLITDPDWTTAKDSSGFSDADYEEQITLVNADGGIALVFNNVTIDAVGWGNSSKIPQDLFEGMPVSIVHEGYSIRRENISEDTDNNVIDFVHSIPDLQNSNPLKNSSLPQTYQNSTQSKVAKDIALQVNVLNSNPKITKIEITPDDDHDLQGTQIIPNPGSTKEVTIKVTAFDTDGIEDITAVEIEIKDPSQTIFIQRFQLNKTNAVDATAAEFSGEFALDYFTEPGVYFISAQATDSEQATGTAITAFTIQEIVAIDLDSFALRFPDLMTGTSAEVLGDKYFQTQNNPTIKNIGNTILDFGIQGSNLTSEKAVITNENIIFSFDNDFESILSNTLTTDPVIKQIGLQPASVQELAFKLYIPESTPKGDYIGNIIVIALAQ